jgi:hypothetical protein
MAQYGTVCTKHSAIQSYIFALVIFKVSTEVIITDLSPAEGAECLVKLLFIL